MKFFRINKYFPDFINTPLFGNRKKFGLAVVSEDKDWKEWEERFLDFYYAIQKSSVSRIMNNAGYSVLRAVSMEKKNVLEIGPGDIPHLQFWVGKPSRYALVDINQELLDKSGLTLQENSIPFEKVHLSRDEAYSLPFPDKSFDMVVSFYSLEHIVDLSSYVDELIRVLTPGGIIIGAIPCEGGFGWGFGRFLTSRRWFKKNTGITSDKIICWEHPNFADKIIRVFEDKMKKKKLSFWPFGIKLIDINLIVSFIYERK
jgi:ubiquinone/menaquinone biosynthesis C-methylase UbiE